jgi:hypothetical protein
MKPYRLGVLILASNIVFDAARKHHAARETVTPVEGVELKNATPTVFLSMPPIAAPRRGFR